MYRFKSVGETLDKLKEKAEEYAKERMSLGKFPTFMLYGLGVIFLLKISQLVLGWSF